MKIKPTLTMMMTLSVAVMLAAVPVMAQSAASLTPNEAKAIAEEAYVYGYPLVTMEYDPPDDDERSRAGWNTGTDGAFDPAA
jgi:hypothetical protein